MSDKERVYLYAHSTNTTQHNDALFIIFQLETLASFKNTKNCVGREQHRKKREKQ